jgi:hypothetical protein
VTVYEPRIERRGELLFCPLAPRGVNLDKCAADPPAMSSLPAGRRRGVLHANRPCPIERSIERVHALKQFWPMAEMPIENNCGDRPSPDKPAPDERGELAIRMGARVSTGSTNVGRTGSDAS